MNRLYHNRQLLSSVRYYSSSGNQSSNSLSSIRETYLKYFQDNGHKRVPSSSLIPHNDNTLLFTNAGMVQFKQYFAGIEQPPSPMMTSSQRCVRAGGKHNDLDNVGYTARHHTFFEMLGNFSFNGGYKDPKRDAIRHAWQLLTGPMGLPKDKLLVSVLEGDMDSANIWYNDIGVPKDKVIFCGAKDNFWSMGDGVGPCGPCTEIFWDRGEMVDGERYLEIWNLVFMQYWRDEKGNLAPLPNICVDTGMGLERMAAVLQGKQSNYEIDLFANMIDRIRLIAESNNSIKVGLLDPSKFTTSLRVIADHLRSICFLIADGVIPSNTGRGYVLRKIIRRALSYGQMIGFDGPFLSAMKPILSEEMGQFYPILNQRGLEIQNVIYNEEIMFYQAIQRGIPYLDDLIQSKKLDEWNLFNLYSTYGLPLEISEVKARQSNIQVDMDKVQTFINQDKEKSKSTWKKDKNQLPLNILKWKNELIKNEFIGYKELNTKTNILGYHFNQSEDDNQIYLCLRECPFYATGGGQIGDRGIVKSITSGREYKVIDTIKPYDGASVVVIEFDPTSQILNHVESDLSVGSQVECMVEPNYRKQSAIHHTATHLLHSALRKVLGEKSVVQAGSYVGPDRLTFDFTNVSKLTPKQLQEIEQLVNEAIQRDIILTTEEMSHQEATSTDAIQLFSEKYGDSVRVVSIQGVSKELCGGTHVKRTGELQLFRIVSETSIAAGVRRIEALAGVPASNWLDGHRSILESLATKLGVPNSNVSKQIDLVLEQKKLLERQVSDLQQQLAMKSIQSFQGRLESGEKCQLHLIKDVNCEDKKLLQDIGNKYAKNTTDSIHIVLAEQDGKILCITGSSLHSNANANADKVLKDTLKLIGSGKGGGNKQMAQASLNQQIDTDIITKLQSWIHVVNKI